LSEVEVVSRVLCSTVIPSTQYTLYPAWGYQSPMLARLFYPFSSYFFGFYSERSFLFLFRSPPVHYFFQLAVEVPLPHCLFHTSSLILLSPYFHNATNSPGSSFCPSVCFLALKFFVVFCPPSPPLPRLPLPGSLPTSSFHLDELLIMIFPPAGAGPPLWMLLEVLPLLSPPSAPHISFLPLTKRHFPALSF